MARVKLSDDVSIDLDVAIESRVIFQANSGGGKSWAARRFIEQTFGKKQLIVIDPEGEFGNMRREFDFVYIGAGGDAPAEPRSAALLARRLLETKANAIIDIYELGSKRGDFVKAFFDACVNMPKELWQDCFFLLDEAHKFAPEKGQGESVALSSVIDMASLGRKRGYCLIPMTQRPAKLSKDVVAECNNKLIGRASLDIDRKRSAEELGFNTKEQILSLRDLAPGEFYAFGPAISRDIVKTTIGDVKVKPPKRGTGRSIKIAPPTAKVKALLSQLADLPQEAEQEIRTVSGFKKKIKDLETALAVKQRPTIAPVIDTRAIDRAIRDTEIRVRKESADIISQMRYALTKNAGTFKKIAELTSRPEVIDLTKLEVKVAPVPLPRPISPQMPKSEPVPVQVSTDGQIGKGETSILIAAAQLQDGASREQLTVLTGYKKSTRNRYIQALQSLGYVELAGEKIKATQTGIDALGENYQPLPTGPELVEHLLRTLPKGEREIFKALVDAADLMEREAITDVTGYQKSTRNRYLQSLAARELIEYQGSAVRLSRDLA